MMLLSMNDAIYRLSIEGNMDIGWAVVMQLAYPAESLARGMRMKQVGKRMYGNLCLRRELFHIGTKALCPYFPTVDVRLATNKA